MKKRTGALCTGVMILGMAGFVQAALVDRGNGMVYDSDQDLTWLRDANYAVTSGYAAANAQDTGGLATDNIFANGRMGWDAAVTWTSQLNHGGYDDWRLPTVTDNGGDGCNFSNNGTDCGSNVDTSGSELAYMWYDNLGNTPYHDTNGNGPQSGWGLTSTSADGVDIENLEAYVYWSGTEYAPFAGGAWRFSSNLGSQDRSLKDNEFLAWAVRSGDVSVVPTPIPAAVWLFGSGLIGLVGWSRRKR